MVTLEESRCFSRVTPEEMGGLRRIAQERSYPAGEQIFSHGTGLGLLICKRIIEDHRGWIRARSEPGRGAIFSFGLPLPQDCLA